MYINIVDQPTDTQDDIEQVEQVSKEVGDQVIEPLTDAVTQEDTQLEPPSPTAAATELAPVKSVPNVDDTPNLPIKLEDAPCETEDEPQVDVSPKDLPQEDVPQPTQQVDAPAPPQTEESKATDCLPAQDIATETNDSIPEPTVHIKETHPVEAQKAELASDKSLPVD